MSLSNDILEMYEYCKDPEMIAESFGIDNVELIRDFLAGKIDNAVIDNFEQDHTKKPGEVVVVNKERLLRSRVVGIFSPGGCGATTLATSMAYLAAQRSAGRVALLDYNEQSDMPLYLGIEVKQDRVSKYLNTAPRDKDNFHAEPVPHYKNSELFLYTGAIGFQNFRTLTPGDFNTGIEFISRTYPITIIDCPQSPLMWNTFLPHLDIYIFVVRQDLMGLHFVTHLQNYIKGLNIQNKTVLVGNMEGMDGYCNAYQFTQQTRSFGLEASYCLPYERDLANTVNQNQIVAEKLQGSGYLQSVCDMLDNLGITESLKPSSSKSFLRDGLKKLFG